MSESNYGKLIPMLIIIIFQTFNYSFNVDYPQALEDKLIRKYKVGTEDVEFLYTIYSGISLIAAPLVGIFMNRVGYSKTGIALAVIGYVGMMITYISITENSWEILIIGRSVFSFAGESGAILCVAIVGERFSGSFTTMAMTIMYAFSRVISIASNLGLPEISLLTRTLKIPFFVGVLGSIIQLIFAMIYWIVYDKKSKDEANDLDISNQAIDQNEERFTLSHIRTLKPLFWSCLMCYTIIGSTMYTLTNTITDLCMIKYGFEYSVAKNFIAVVQFGQVIIMPISGAIMQKYGYKSSFILAGSVLSVISLIWMAMLDLNSSPWVAIWPFILFALYFALYGPAIFPCMTMSLPKDAASIGLSFSTILQQLTLSITPVIVGRLSAPRTPEAYQRCLYFITALAIFGLVLSIIVIIFDRTEGFILHLPENSEEVQKLRHLKNMEFRQITKNLSRDKNKKGFGSFTEIEKNGYDGFLSRVDSQYNEADY